ncbi:sulfate transporter N-terminal domain with GLY motif-domain-containing protein [Chytriomyces cf. hyalinus JEL632]|nr:sulfate transporter N-terminal domain with GLY motif-domain-containing protein [Chytriomyces cf. hyalinus JEL632]
MTALETGVSKVAMVTTDEVVKIQNAEPAGDAKKRCLKRVFPFIDQVKTHNRQLFLDDVIAAFTIAFILLPQAIAYASLAHIGPILACVAAIFPVMLYPLFGASRHLSVGPEAVVSVVTGTAGLGIMAETTAYTAEEIANSLAFMVGLVCIVLAIVRAGFIDSILSGYLAGWIRASGKYKVDVLGTFDTRLPLPALPILTGDLFARLIQPAFITMLVGFIESQTVTRKFGLHFGYFPTGDQELVALGFINLVSSIAGGFPLFCSLPRSRVLVNTSLTVLGDDELIVPVTRHPRGGKIQMFKRAGWYEDMAEDVFPSVDQGMAAVESRTRNPRWFKKRW